VSVEPVHAHRFPPLPPERAAQWSQFGRWSEPSFVNLVGIVLEEVRTDYARMRLPYRPALRQPAGVVHGGALATLIDVVVVPAVGGPYAEFRPLLTVDMHVSYLDAVREEDAVAEGWVEKRGRSTVFCRAEVRTAGGRLATTASLIYKVGPPVARPPGPVGADEVRGVPR
jgi:uncharacterized protein (TIGR00369 family)